MSSIVSPCTTPEREWKSAITSCDVNNQLTSKIFSELVFHLQSTFMSLLRLFIAHAAVHFPVGGRRNRKSAQSRVNGFGSLTLSIQRILVWWILRWDKVEPLGAVWLRCPKHREYSASFAFRPPLLHSQLKFHKDCRYTAQLYYLIKSPIKTITTNEWPVHTFDEQMILDITFHLLARRDKVIVTSIVLVFTLGSSGICLENSCFCRL